MTTQTTLLRHKYRIQDAQNQFEAEVRKAVAEGIPKSKVAKMAGISRPTLYAILNR